MDQIEVNIKLASNNLIYNIPIRKADTILKLKEYCHKISNIPQDQQNLIYKGKILSNEKVISDYEIENNHNIILVKKEKSKPVNAPLLDNSDSSNLNEQLFNYIKSIPTNKEINFNELSNFYRQIPNLSSLINIDINKVNNLYQFLGFKSFSDIFGIEPQKYKELLKDPQFMDLIKNILLDPSLLKIAFNNPKAKIIIQNNPIMKHVFQSSGISSLPLKYILMLQNQIKEEEENINESSGTEIIVPPDPFGSVNNNQMLNSSGQISDINIFNSNKTGNKDIFGNSGIDIDFKEEYKNQLSQLKDMGFINEETNIKALKQSNGNINNTLEILLKEN